jgi:hypothetical protein
MGGSWWKCPIMGQPLLFNQWSQKRLFVLDLHDAVVDLGIDLFKRLDDAFIIFKDDVLMRKVNG